MLLPWSEELVIYATGARLSARKIARVNGSKSVVDLGTRSWRVEDPQTLDLGWLEGEVRKGTSVSVLLGAAVCRFAVILTPAGLTNEQDVRAVIEVEARDFLGLSNQGWRMSIEEDSTRASDKKRQSRLVCAVSETVLERLEELVQELGLRLRSVSPFPVGALAWWSEASEVLENGVFADAAVADFGVAIVEPDSMMSALVRAARIDQVSAIRHDGTSTAVQAELQRARAAWGLDESGPFLLFADRSVPSAHVDTVIDMTTNLSTVSRARFFDQMAVTRVDTRMSE